MSDASWGVNAAGISHETVALDGLSGRHMALSSAMKLTLGIIGFRLIVDLAYRMLVAGPFYYQGFRNAPTIQALLLSWVFLLALVPLLSRVFRSETLSAQVTMMLFLVSVVPTTTLIAHDPRYTISYIGLMFLYWLIFLLACVFLPAIRPFRRPLRSEIPHLLTLVILLATVVYISWRYTGFRLHFGLFDIYDIRAEAREYSMATILGYLVTIADNTLPILLAYYLRRRWVFVAALVAVVIFFNFGIVATKQVLFLLVFAVASIAIREHTRLNRKMFVALAVVVSMGIIERLAIGTMIIGSIAMHRLLFIPAHLHWIYYDFFQINEYLYLTQSALRFFFESSYRENVQFLIGEYFIGQFSARANNGLFSDGYQNFGPASVLFYPILTVFLLKLFEGASKGLQRSVQFMVIVVLTIVLESAPLLTAMLTSGLAVLVLLLTTLPRPTSLPGDAAAARREESGTRA